VSLSNASSQRIRFALNANQNEMLGLTLNDE